MGRFISIIEESASSVARTHARTLGPFGGIICFLVTAVKPISAAPFLPSS